MFMRSRAGPTLGVRRAAFMKKRPKRSRVTVARAWLALMVPDVSEFSRAPCAPNKSVKPTTMLCLLPALASLLPSARLASPHASMRAAVRMAEPVESDAILKGVLRSMPLEWGESFEARMERAQAAAVAKGGGPYAAYTKPAFLTKFTRPVLAKDPEGYKQGYEEGRRAAAPRTINPGEAQWGKDRTAVGPAAPDPAGDSQQPLCTRTVAGRSASKVVRRDTAGKPYRGRRY